jgi:hypothetical protein
MAKAMNCRPSQVYGLEEGSFEAYALDSAVVRFGSAFEAAVSDATNGAKNPEAAEAARHRVLRRWLPSERRYADPAKRGSQL